MKQSAIQQVYNLLSDEDMLVEFANSEGGETISKGDMRVAQKAAALVAVLGSAFMDAYDESRDGVMVGEFERNLYLYANGVSGPNRNWRSMYVAHLTWLSGQFFRGSEKIARISQFNFLTLGEESILKDADHIKRAAAFLLSKLQQQNAGAA